MAAKFLGRDGEKNHVEAIRSGGLIISGGRPRPAVERLGRLRSISRAPALDLDKVKPGEQQADSARHR